jgi:hypothetical protein
MVFSLLLLEWSGQCFCIFQLRTVLLFNSVPLRKCRHGNFTPFYTFCNSPFIIILSLLIHSFISLFSILSIYRYNLRMWK